MTTDHTCNGGCSRCSPELNISYWIHKHQVATQQADIYRQILTSILSNISDPVTLNWMGSPNVVIKDQHQFINDVHHARRMMTSGSS